MTLEISQFVQFAKETIYSEFRSAIIHFSNVSHFFEDTKITRYPSEDKYNYNKLLIKVQI